MTSYPKFSSQSFPWFRVGLAGVFLFAIALRFWGLSRFNTLVFDEVYFAKFAAHYLKGIPLFEGHPPLSTYLIAFGIWVTNHMSGGDDIVKNGFTSSWLSPFSYRWLNALTGALIPLVIAAIAYQLSHRRSYALIAALFAATDGLFLVESRYALINVYLVIFGLLGHWLFLLALNTTGKNLRLTYLLLSGICLGAAIAVKWSGLGFLLGIYLVWMAAWVARLMQLIRPKALVSQDEAVLRHPLQNLTQLNLGQILLNFALIPAIAYRLVWIPYINLDPSTSFWEWQAEIVDYHKRVGGMDAHAYCSPWYTWILMLRPVAYFRKAAHEVMEPAPVVGPPLPQGTGEIIYDVHAIGNPALWWLSTAAILLLLGMLVQRLWIWATPQEKTPFARTDPFARIAITPGSATYTWTAVYLGLNWAANWLPWMKVTRCLFLYHYMGSAVFSLLAIAWMVDRWLQHPQRHYRAAGITAIFLVLLAFVFWLPLYLGLPLSPEALKMRYWFRSWV